MAKSVTLTHPDTKAKVEADPENVAMYESQGWEQPASQKP